MHTNEVHIGSYTILSKIDSGAFGSVYKGKHSFFKQNPLVAIKVLRSDLVAQKEQDMFIQEAQLLKKLEHPNILPIIDMGMSESGMYKDSLYLILKYAAEGSLQNLLQRQLPKPLSLDKAINIIVQVGSALHYAHQKNVVHRDLKPANILFESSTKILLADFGIAIVLTSEKTKKAGVGGTPYYMAPEQFEGSASKKSDQYALGCIAYELFTGRRPFIIPEPTQASIAYHHLYINPPLLRDINPSVPTHIEQAVLKALAKKSEERFTSVSAFVTALRGTKTLWFNEGIARFNNKQYAEALVVFEQALKLDEKYAEAYNAKGRALHACENYEGALEVYSRAIRLRRNYVSAYINKGETLYILGRYKEALHFFDSVIKLEPKNAEVYNLKGTTLSKEKKYAEALEAYNKAIEYDPKMVKAHYNKGNTLNKQERYEQALAAFNTAILLNKYDPMLYYGKGTALYYCGKYGEALDAYNFAIGLKPNYMLAYCGKGDALCELGRFKDALVAYEKALKLDPQHTYAQSGKVFVCKELGLERVFEQDDETLKQINRL